MNCSSQRLRSVTGSLALYSSLVSSVLKKLLMLGWPARSMCAACHRRTLDRPPDVDLGLGAEFTGGQLDHNRKHVRPGVRIDACPRRLAVEMLPLASKRFLIPSRSKKNASLRLPAKKL